jgi:hypothetical protein
MRHFVRLNVPIVCASLGLLFTPIERASAQMSHGSHGGGGAMPAEGGQAVFAAVSEIVRLLEADSTTDWSKVNLEALRQHLMDMDHVALRSRVAATWVPGGEMWAVRGTGATVGAIRRMTAAHAAMMGMDNTIRIARRELPDGVLLTVTAADPKDAALVAKIRALDFIGFMASGTHHQMHHLMLARGVLGGHGH